MFDKIVDKIFDKEIDHVGLIFLSLNWIFGLLFLWAGFFDVKAGGILIILISLLLLPPVRNAVFSLTNRSIQVWARSLCIFSLFVVFFMINNPKQAPMSLEAQLTAQANSIKKPHENTKILANKSPSIQIKSKKKDLLPEKAVEIKSPINEQVNLIKNDKSDSEIKTNEILAKIKKIPASQYEQNRNLYQQLVAFNPNKDDYKKKLSFYSNKIIQQSRNTATKNTELTCEKIISDETYNDSPDWLSDNGHCLSENQKKKMEVALLTKVKKISSKKFRQNWEGYKSLSILNPTKESYLKKLEHYKNKLEIKTAKI